MIEFPLPWWTAPVVGAVIGDSLGYLISRAMGRRVTWKDSSTLWWPVRAWKRWSHNRWVFVSALDPLFHAATDYYFLPGRGSFTSFGDHDDDTIKDAYAGLKVRAWLLRDIKALGAQGAWDKHNPATAPGSPTLNRTALQAAVQSVRNAAAQRQAQAGLQPAGLQAAMQNTLITPTQTQQLAQMMQNASQYGTSLQPQALQPPSWHSQWASAALQVPAPQGTVTGLLGPSNPVPYVAGQQVTLRRRPDPVSDPYLAANDFADELKAHLGLDSVADLPVKAYMLWVGIRAAQKDGEPWEDMDARLHEVAGVPYVSPAERRAMELRTVAGALYMAEWAVEDPGVRDGYRLYMTAGTPDTAFGVSLQDVVEVDAKNRLVLLLKRAPSAVIYTAYVDLAGDRIVITDGKMRRYMDLPAREVDVSSALENASQSALRQLWKVAMPADGPAPYTPTNGPTVPIGTQIGNLVLTKTPNGRYRWVRATT